MTEQEAKVLAARLERIWMPGGVCSSGLADEGNDWRFHFSCEPEAGTTLRFEICELRGMEVVLEGNCGRLRWSPHYPQIEATRVHPLMNVLTSSRRPTLLGLLRKALLPGNLPTNWEAQATEFGKRWREEFQRKCWLSGCDIEASAHEKLEWMQGFTREEMQAWNLGF